ncbi:MAG: hypothetical protein QXW97_02995 [Candidatus Pacearchaeota archaeon]
MKTKFRNANIKINKNLIIVLTQVGFVILVLICIYVLYPKSEISINGNFVKFSSINAKVITISENPDFSNPRYIDLTEVKNVGFNLNPGTYYWKADNGIISGLSNKFTIKSNVGLVINRTENETNLVNIGNVKVNVTRDKSGSFVGHVILSPEQSQKIEDSGIYLGRQDGI